MAYQQTLANGTVLIEEFQILGHLGSGGFANTYLAMDLTLGREVAVKEYFPSELAVRSGDARVEVKSQAHGAQFEWALGRFVREAKTLAKFRHPSVVRVFRVFNANHTAYIVLEFVRGSNMEAWLKGLGRQPTQAELDELLPPLLDALEVVHSAGILHRDIKPANIYIRASDHTPVLLDFGAARYAAGDYAGTTAAIVSKGYSPHEAYATDSRLQGPWTDIYGLAATIYRALAGSAPPESTMRVLEDHCVAATELDLPASGGYRQDFLAAVDWALGVMPKQRPQSVAEWRHKLLPVSASMPRLRDANGDPTTVQEWNPLSDRDSDATTFDPPGGPGSARRVASVPSGAQPRASRPSGSSHTAAPASDRSVQRNSVIVGVSNSTSGAVKPRSSGSIAASRTTSGPHVPSHGGVIDRQSQPLGNRAFMIGIVLFAAGGIALLGQWFMSRKPAPVQIAAPLSSPDGRASSAIDRNRIEREQRQAAETARAEDDRRIAEQNEQKARQDRDAEAKRLADERARQERDAEARRLADEKARQERDAEAKRLADEKARQERDAEAKRLADEKARQERDAEAKRLADEKARQQREAEAKRLADEKARQEREAEAKRLADEKARQEREAEARRLADEKARQEREAEAKRLADEKARQEREAEAKRLADEKARREREAEAKRLADEKARQEREAEAKRLADEKARQEREAEAKRLADEKARQEREAEAKRLAEEKARTANDAIKVAANTAAFSTGPDRDFPLTGAVGGEEGARRTAYLKQIQTVLKNSRCYDGAVTGDVDSTRSALEMFEKSYQGSMKKLDVASASSSDLEVWLGWFWRQESSSCAGAPDTSRRDREAEEARQERRRQREAEEARQERQRQRAAEEARQERQRERAAEEARQERQRERAAEQARQRQREERPAKKVEREKPAKQVYKAPAPVYRAPKSSGGGGGGGGSSDLLRGGR